MTGPTSKQSRKASDQFGPKQRFCPCGAELNHKQMRICAECRDDPAKLFKARQALMRQAEDEAAHWDTRNLSRETATTPLDGEKAVLAMLRGDWK